MRNLLASPILLTALLLPACSDDNDDLVDDAIVEGETLGDDLAAQAELELAPQDPETIAGMSGAILIAIDESEILLADFILDISLDPIVLDFADQMVIEHSGHLLATEDLLDSLALVPIENEVSAELAAEAENTLRLLESAGDPDFEYMRSQVVMHAGSVIILETLLAFAPFDELQGWIEDTIDVISDHRDRAEEILRDL